MVLEGARAGFMAGKFWKIPRGQNPPPMWLTGIMMDCLEGPSGADVHD